MKRHTTFWMLALLAMIIVLFIVNLLIGSVKIPVADICRILTGGHDNEIWQNIIMKSRVPQALTAVMAGAGLAVSGLQMQTVFRNPLAGPSVLGISNGASLGVAFVVLLSGNLGGVALSQLGYLGDAAMSIAAIMGSLAVMALIVYVSQNVSGDQMVLFVFLLAILLPLSCLLVKTMNLLLLGDGYARNLGLNIRRARLLVIGSSGILVAIVTAYCGPIMFIGLAVPHLCRAIFRTSDHRVLMPGTALTGAALALVCNLIARMPGFEGALPVNSVTALVGAPIIASVLFRRRKDDIQE